MWKCFRQQPTPLCRPQDGTGNQNRRRPNENRGRHRMYRRQSRYSTASMRASSDSWPNCRSQPSDLRPQQHRCQSDQWHCSTHQHWTVSRHIHISANICRDTGIRTSDTGVITQTNRSWRTSRACEAAIIRRGAVGGKKGGNGDGGHHGNCDCGGGQGAGMREGAGRYHSRSRVMLWRRAPRSASEQSLHHVP